jgi:hypothetical protein
MKRIAAALIVAVVYALHQDLWFWRVARPLVFGVLPIGLFYHAAYTLSTSLVLWLLVRWLWPADLDGRLDSDVGSPLAGRTTTPK